MTLFHYPKAKHARRLKPRLFKRYQSYKRFLQSEFARVCVYCRQPDSSAPNLIFGIDHYKPKGIRRFEGLVCAYDNLYYCCGNCNSRKSDYWPVDEKSDPHVVNPCDYEMAAHLRFDATTGRIDARSVHGEHTRDLLQLNDEATVQYRLGALRTVKLFRIEIENLDRQIKEIERIFSQGKISQDEYDAEIQDAQHERNLLLHTLQAQTGELPLAPLKTTKGSIVLLMA